MFHKGLTAALLAAVLSFGASASVTQGTQGTTQTSGAGRYDSDITKDIQDKLKKDRFKDVKASVNDGMVTLTGTVELYAHKHQAEDRVKDVDHVQGVSNRIEVRGKQVSDAELQEKLADKLRYDRVNQGIVFNNLTLEVRNGYATIGGSVYSEADAASAVAIAENMPGVKGVRDEITVQPTSIHDDDLRIALARRIYGDSTLQRYAMDPQAPIRIVVNRGKVTLHGVVNSEADKTVAGMRAREVPGSFSVDNQLVVAGRESAKK